MKKLPEGNGKKSVKIKKDILDNKNKFFDLIYFLNPEKIKYINDEIKIKYPIIPILEAISKCI